MPDGLARQSVAVLGWGRSESLLFVLPRSSSSARHACGGVRTRIRDLHTENIANLAVRARELGDVMATAPDRVVAAMN